jgi:predicted short-subunit dehydrogenase-like oxidoreductase (DUF2520 family)
MNIILIGAGNVATRLGLALKEKGFSITQVYSRTAAAAETLGRLLQTAHTHRLEDVMTTADVYFFAVTDSALPLILKDFPPNEGLWVHTAGSIPMDVFNGSAARRTGVFYPLQTFGKHREIVFEHIPIFLENSHPEDKQILEHIAHSLSDTVIHLSSEKRKHLHLAAVFACNFTNHLYNIASQILDEQGIDWRILLPLINETVAKLRTLSPQEAQTGPAARGDAPVLETHLKMLENDPDKQTLYRIITQSIYNDK